MTKRRLLRIIAKTKARDMQEVLDAAQHRYQELYPEWEIYYFSLKRGDEACCKEQLQRILEFASKHGAQS